VLSPVTTAADSTVTITGTLTNETAHQQLGSANLFWPSGFDVTAASVSPGSASLALSCTLNGFADGPCVQLRDLSLAPGESATTTMTVRTPSPCASYTWQVEAKQANDYKGTPGNDFDLDNANSSLTTQVTSPCAVGLGFDTQPHNAYVGDPITGADLDPSGPPVTVDVLDENGNLLASSKAPISVALGHNPTGGTLAGTKTVNASGGVATFSDLSVDTPGHGYTLAASSPDLTGATSSPFNIVALPTPPQEPVYGHTVEVAPVSGDVCVKPKNGTQFHPLGATALIHVGSIIDTTNGTVKLRAAKRRNNTQFQHARFSLGPFKVTQAKNGRPYTKLTLAGSSGCTQATAGAKGTAVYQRHRRRHRRRIYGSGSGNYRTSGHHGSGSTIGKRQAAELQEPFASTRSRRTKWLTANRRKGTFFRVDKGTLVVHDFTLDRKVKLHAGQSYLAPAHR
jgi:hypothetical protein